MMKNIRTGNTHVYVTSRIDVVDVKCSVYEWFHDEAVCI